MNNTINTELYVVASKNLDEQVANELKLPDRAIGCIIEQIRDAEEDRTDDLEASKDV